MIRDLALLAARLAVGAGMASHGAQKALGWFEGPGPAGAAKLMHALGFRPGETYAQAASWNEIASGGLIALGLGGPIGPAMMISTMIVAQASVHWKNGFFAQKGGIELGVLYAAAALTFAATDYGGASFDAALGLREKLRDPLFTTLVLAGGIAAALIALNNRDDSLEGPATPTFRGKNSPLPADEPAPAA
jgi:putative oxidoreductase